jgi:hypothetical protein
MKPVDFYAETAEARERLKRDIRENNLSTDDAVDFIFRSISNFISQEDDPPTRRCPQTWPQTPRHVPPPRRAR